ncbi:Isopenicillin N epimerase [Streptomyces sp. YIM 121038]|uniref:aminotransferase class V-fold PLP-dependent enzyme n=1 Tax=Streptomyces sp. YIM 121038 TaxID=2136401 RepID=UPI001162C8A3|nr:aminotransferase class V-fold PLP-dependent enzyme [Streptomyces sp. YIM 121038]QCX81572.1 Isopenicillin N epimerase [Streptomyces sp. YIM 121038]
MDRRSVLAGAVGSAAVAAWGGGVAEAVDTAGAGGRRLLGPDGRPDWGAVRAQFRLDPAWVHLATFYLASQPRAVRAAVDHLARQLDADPMLVPTKLSLPDGPTDWDRVRKSLAGYLGGEAEHIALAASTTIGLGLVYNGVRVRPGQEFLLSEDDHTVHQGAARLAAEKHGARVRLVPWFADSGEATAEEVVSAVRAQLRPTTRVLGVTWVQSRTGVRMPVEAVAEVVREANRGRAEADRCLLVVDGVHGLAAVDADAARLGADVVVAGTHKWLLGPRGTALVWLAPHALAQVRPTFASFMGDDGAAPLSPGGFLAYEHAFALPVSVAFHQALGRSRVAGRIAELSTRAKEGLARIPGVRLHTPVAPGMSAGITCFSVRDLPGSAVVERAAARKVRLSSLYHDSLGYARIGTGVMNSPRDVDVALRVVRDIAG